MIRREALQRHLEAEAQAKAEREYFRDVVMPARIAQVEADLTRLAQELWPGVEFKFDYSEV